MVNSQLRRLKLLPNMVASNTNSLVISKIPNPEIENGDDVEFDTRKSKIWIKQNLFSLAANQASKDSRSFSYSVRLLARKFS